jgi:hypothetical protein
MDWAMASPNPAWCNPARQDVISYRHRVSEVWKYLCGLDRTVPPESKSAHCPCKGSVLHQQAGRQVGVCNPDDFSKSRGAHIPGRLYYDSYQP